MNGRILIVGGGIAGLMMKYLLEAQGYSAVLAEKDDALRADGAGLLLGANVLKIFKSIGLEKELLDNAQSLDDLLSLDDQGVPIGKIDLLKIFNETGFSTVAIHRQRLHSILSTKIDQDTLWLSHEVENIAREGEHYEVFFSNKKVELFDHVIAADGLFSTVRKKLFGDIGLRNTHQGCWRFIIDAPEDIEPNHAFELWGDQKRVGIFPLQDNKLYCFLVKSLQGDEKKISFDAVLELFEDFKGPWEKIKGTINTASTELLYGELADAKKITLEKDGILFIGDAGHSTTPNMGQGAAMGIESAYIFSELLKEHSFERALELYVLKRSKKVSKIRETSFLMGKIAHTRPRFLQKIRNALLRVIPQKMTQKEFERSIF